MTQLEEEISHLIWDPQPFEAGSRRAVAGLLAGASLVLGGLARRLAPESPAPAPRGVLAPAEFYAEAGAVEGALYVGGELVGWVRGVVRL